MRDYIIFLLILLVAGGAYWYYKMPKFSEEEIAPDFTAPTITGSELSLSDFRGQYVLLDFWGSWCPPCRAENPLLVKLYDKYKTATFRDASAFTIVSVGIERNVSAWQRAITKDGLSWPHHVSSLKRLKDPVAKLYGVNEIPTKYLIGPKGNILAVNPPVEVVDVMLQAKIKE